MAQTPTVPQNPDEIRSLVRDAYGRLARQSSSCCGGRAAAEDAPASAGCCGPAAERPDARTIASRIGYSEAELDAVPDGANLGLGCGNPGALASLRKGEVVVDLGAGAGLDALLAAQAVGPEGRVIGIDMTPEMLARARTNAVEAGVAGTVEFREGIIEDLPVVDGSADALISNCVINLSPDKPRVFREAFRVLKPGGRLAVSDIVLSAPLPEPVRELATAWVGCVAGAMLERDYLAAIEAAGFVEVRVTRSSLAPLVDSFRRDPIVQAALAAIGEAAVAEAAASVWSVRVEAHKPAVARGA
jgi:ubiquinone/menaquinone biosynthesis C-methylase UbiE